MDYVQHFAARVVQDAINEGLAATWQRRRAAFLGARPRRADFHGQATSEELRDRYERLTAISEACGARACVSLGHEGLDDDVREAIAC